MNNKYPITFFNFILLVTALYDSMAVAIFPTPTIAVASHKKVYNELNSKTFKRLVPYPARTREPSLRFGY